MTLRRSMLSLLLIAGVAAAMVTVASMATFSDQVVSESNALEAGTLYLSVDDACGDRGAGSDTACGTDFTFDSSITKPGDTGSWTFDVVNEGSVDGLLTVGVEGATDCFEITTDPSPLPSGLALAGNGSTDVTVTVSMPGDADNECQGVETDVTVTFDLAQA